MKSLFNITLSALFMLLLATSSIGQQGSPIHTPATTNQLSRRLNLLGLHPTTAFTRAHTAAAPAKVANQAAPSGKVYNFASVDFPGSAMTIAAATNGKTDVGTFNFDPSSGTSPNQSFTHSANKYKIYVVPGAAETALLGINSLGVMVGTYFDSSNVAHGFIDNAGTITTVDFPGSTSTNARGINDNSDVVGTYYDAIQGFHGFAEIGGVFTTLDYPGATQTYAIAINASGQVAGTWTDGNYSGHGFIWANGVFTSLDFPGALDTEVRGLNNAGKIVG